VADGFLKIARKVNEWRKLWPDGGAEPAGTSNCIIPGNATACGSNPIVFTQYFCDIPCAEAPCAASSTVLLIKLLPASALQEQPLPPLTNQPRPAPSNND
jgi:hypothetical protein